MIDDVLLEGITCLVDEIHMNVRIVRIYLATTLIDWHKHWLDAGCGLGHETGGTGWCNGETSDVAASVFHHIVIQLWIDTLDAVDKRIVFLTFSIIHFEGTTFLGHRD